MRKFLTKIVVLSAVFTVSLLCFARLFEQEETKSAAAMKKPTLPVLYMQTAGVQMNPMYGYRQELALAALRDHLTPVPTTRELSVAIEPHGNGIKKVTYEVLTPDSGEVSESNRIKSFSDAEGLKTAEFRLEMPILMNREYVLRFTVVTEEGKTVYYYTRLLQRSGLNMSKYLEFAQNFTEQCLDKDEAEGLAVYLEPDKTVTNQSYTKVNIHSSFDQITWGSLAPELVLKPVPIIKEMNETTASVGMEYVISAQDEEEHWEYYSVTEFYRMRYYNSQVMLLDFERSAQQIFYSEIPVLTSRGLRVGVASKDISYQTNTGGDIVTFVQNGELWSYNRSSNKIARVFGFREAKNPVSGDARLQNNSHDIKIVRVGESGDIDFVVYGYMNSDWHEGEVGIGVYRYSAQQNVAQEELFIPVNQPFEYLKRDLSKLTYVNQNRQLYLMLGEALYRVDLNTGKSEAVREKIAEACFAVSKAQNQAAWAEEMSENASKNITVMNFDTGERRSIHAAEGQNIRVIGFINEDFVYGSAAEGQIFTDDNQKTSLLLNSILIQDMQGNLKKEYSQNGVVISSVKLAEGLLELERMRWQEGEGYVPISGDQIMNLSAVGSGRVEVSLSVSERQGTRVTLQFEREGKTKNQTSVYGKLLWREEADAAGPLVSASCKDGYYVYAKGRLAGIYSAENEAVREADAQMGIVLDTAQRYVWERGNKPDFIRLMEENIPEAMKSATLDAQALQEVLGVEYEVLNLSGCTVDSVLYLVGRGYPVIAKLSETENVVITGYDPNNTWYYLPASQEIKPMASDDSRAAFAAAGNIFIGYIKK